MQSGLIALTAGSNAGVTRFITCRQGLQAMEVRSGATASTAKSAPHVGDTVNNTVLKHCSMTSRVVGCASCLTRIVPLAGAPCHQRSHRTGPHLHVEQATTMGSYCHLASLLQKMSGLPLPFRQVPLQILLGTARHSGVPASGHETSEKVGGLPHPLHAAPACTTHDAPIVSSQRHSAVGSNPE